MDHALESDAACAQIDELAENLHGDRRVMDLVHKEGGARWVTRVEVTEVWAESSLLSVR